jgi:hypothetical protein
VASEWGIMEYGIELSALSLSEEGGMESEVVEAVISGLESCGEGLGSVSVVSAM